MFERNDFGSITMEPRRLITTGIQVCECRGSTIGLATRILLEAGSVFALPVCLAANGLVTGSSDGDFKPKFSVWRLLCRLQALNICLGCEYCGNSCLQILCSGLNLLATCCAPKLTLSLLRIRGRPTGEGLRLYIYSTPLRRSRES